MKVTSPILPPGISSGVEIYLKGTCLYALYAGREIPYNMLPQKIQKQFEIEFESASITEVIKQLFSEVETDEDAFTQWMVCNFGGFNMSPDFHANIEKEYWDCGCRGNCPAEGVVCTSVGLSSREIDVVRFVGRGFPDKLIAEELSISLNTVKTYLGRIRQKLGLYNRVEVAAFANKNNIT